MEGAPFLAQSPGQTQGSPLKCGEALELCSGLFSLSAGAVTSEWRVSGLDTQAWCSRGGSRLTRARLCGPVVRGQTKAG